VSLAGVSSVVPAGAPRIVAGADRAGVLGQQIDRRRPAQQLDEAGAEAATDLESECLGVEAGAGFDVGHVDVEQQ
jgi:hypothetical protein